MAVYDYPKAVWEFGGSLLICCLSFLITLICSVPGRADPAGSVEFTADGFSANESSRMARVVLIRNSLFGDPFTVDFATHDASAQSNPDYVPTNGTIRFASGQTNATITIRLLDDSLFEGLETFTVELSNPTGGRHSRLAAHDHSNHPG